MRILLATDGSEYSQRAVTKCCEFIRSGTRTDVKIVSAVERVMPMAAEPFGISGEYYLQVEDDLKKQANAAVEDAEKRIRMNCAGADISVEKEVLTGSVKQIIVDEAEKFGADLIIVGSHGYGFLDRVLLGSVSDFVTHHAPCSVLVVRADK